MTATITARERTHALNAEFRRAGPLFGRRVFDGVWVVSANVQAMGPSFVSQALAAAQTVNLVDRDESFDGDQDWGWADIAGQRVVWAIDCVQRGTPLPARDPSDNAATCRVITIMVDDEA